MKYFPYFYKITIVRVLDGDTVEADFDLGFNITHRVTVRMAGYDAPETFRPKTEAEKLVGEMCKDHLQALLEAYEPQGLYCKSTKIDLYGRSTGILYFTNSDSGAYISINDLMASWIIAMGYNKAKLREKTLEEELRENDSWSPSA